MPVALGGGYTVSAPVGDVLPADPGATSEPYGEPAGAQSEGEAERTSEDHG